MALFLGEKLLAGSFIPTVDTSDYLITVTETQNLDTLTTPGLYVGEASVFNNDPAAAIFGEDVISKAVVIVSRAIVNDLYCVSQIVLYFGKVYVREISQQGSYPTTLAAIEWEQVAVENSEVNFSSIEVSGEIHANKVYGAVWNDYAEYREGPDCAFPGEVVCEKGDDTLVICDEDMAAGCYIVSDTFGFAIGQTKKANLPVAVSGRVLAYTTEDRMTYKDAIGRPVCGTKGGKIRLMTNEEAAQFPWKILGTVSSVPEYKTWGEKEVEVNGRIWVKVR